MKTKKKKNSSSKREASNKTGDALGQTGEQSRSVGRSAGRLADTTMGPTLLTVYLSGPTIGEAKQE